MNFSTAIDLMNRNANSMNEKLNPLSLTRRQMLGRMATGIGMVGLGGMLGAPRLALGLNPAISGQKPNLRPKAKRVIFLFLNGGPSHVDTFDPKPALLKHEGQEPSGDLYKKARAHFCRHP